MATRGSPCCMAGKALDVTWAAIWVVPPIRPLTRLGPDVAMTVCTFRPAALKKPWSWAITKGSVSALVGKLPTVTLVRLVPVGEAWVLVPLRAEAWVLEEPQAANGTARAARPKAPRTDRRNSFIFFCFPLMGLGWVVGLG